MPAYWWGKYFSRAQNEDKNEDNGHMEVEGETRWVITTVYIRNDQACIKPVEPEVKSILKVQSIEFSFNSNVG